MSKKRRFIALCGVMSFFLITLPIVTYGKGTEAKELDCKEHRHYFTVTGGGSLPLQPGVRLFVFPGSLTNNVWLTAESCTDNTTGDLETKYHFGPSGTTFDPPAWLIVERGARFDFLQGECYYWDDFILDWVLLVPIEEPFGNKVIFEIPHFSLYAIITNHGESEIEDCP